MRKNNFYILYLFCYIGKGYDNCINYGNSMSDIGIIVIIDKIRYGKFVKFL